MNIVIDSNILFSILIKDDGTIAGLFRLLKPVSVFYISDYSFNELNKHQNKLIKASKINLQDFEKIKISIISQCEIIPENLFSKVIIKASYDLVKDIDLDDLPFVAAALFINGYLWTGDKQLYKGLKAKGFNMILNANDIKQMINYE